MSPPSRGGEVTLEVVQIKMGGEGGGLWLGCGKALQWGGDVDVVCACETDGPKV